MKKRNRANLPEDLVAEEIFSRVPASSLARFRSTSKRFNALVKDEKFCKKHSANGPKQSLFIMLIDFRIHLVRLDLHGNNNKNNNVVVPSAKVTSQFSLKDPLFNSSEQVDIRTVFHCDGLLLCSSVDNRLVVWNPCSSETMWIQPRNCYKVSDYYALGYDEVSSCYKILRIYPSRGRTPFHYKYDIYDFTSNKWRGVGKKTKDWFIPWCRGRGVSVNGNTYWLAFSRSELDQRFLLSFDFSTERFQSQSLPRTSPNCVAALSVVKEDQLCLLTHEDVNPLDINLWIATKTESIGSGAMSWGKFLTAKANYKFSRDMSFVANKQDKVVVCCDNTEFPNNILHIVADDRYIQVDDDHGADQLDCPLLLSYVPTLVQIPQGI